MAKKPDPVEKKLCAAALRLAASHKWRALTIAQIARAAKVSPAQAQKHFADANALLPALVRWISGETETAVGKAVRGTLHDRLFEVMMTRFDVLQKHRKGILGILEESRRDARVACGLIPAQIEAMRAMLKLAGHNGHDLVAGVGLGLVYAATLLVWKRDEAIDMAKTMAALDRNLRHAERVGAILFPGA